MNIIKKHYKTGLLGLGVILLLVSAGFNYAQYNENKDLATKIEEKTQKNNDLVYERDQAKVNLEDTEEEKLKAQKIAYFMAEKLDELDDITLRSDKVTWGLSDIIENDCYSQDLASTERKMEKLREQYAQTNKDYTMLFREVQEFLDSFDDAGGNEEMF